MRNALHAFLLILTVTGLQPVAAQNVEDVSPSQNYSRGRGTASESASDTMLDAPRPSTIRFNTASPPPANSSPAIIPPVPDDKRRLLFGSQLFAGNFAGSIASGFNPGYELAVGDRVLVRMWGAYNLDSAQPIDPQGNIFIPNVGPINLLGVKNSELNAFIEARIKKTYRSNVGVYASLETAQPVKLFVTGFVRAPGLYGGLSSNSILHYLDKAGGVDPDRGSYLAIELQRGSRTRARFDLYKFLLDGQLESLQLQDGDTIVVGPRQHTVSVEGEALNPYIFEFTQATIPASQLLALARPKPDATHLSIVRRAGPTRRSESYPLNQIAGVTITDGDEVSLVADKYPGTLLIRIEGAHLGARSLVVPYGTRLKDALAQVRAPEQANLEAIQLFRRSVATRQKELIDIQIRSLENYALGARSATNEEAQLRSREADQILKLVERARTINPRGQVVLASDRKTASDMLLEDGDVIRVPERSALVSVGGEVMFPNTLVYQEGASARDYIAQAGGFSQRASDSKIVVLHQDGTVANNPRGSLQPGDEVMVLPEVRTKTLEFTRAVTTILYQIAIAAKVVLDL